MRARMTQIRENIPDSGLGLGFRLGLGLGHCTRQKTGYPRS